MPGYIAAQLAGGVIATVFITVRYPRLTAEQAADAVIPTEARA